MACCSKTCLFILLIILISFFFFDCSVQVLADDEADNLFQSINAYRKPLNLSTLTENDNAECLAEQIAKQYKGQACTNSTGSNTVPGTEEQFPNYPDLLSNCHLNITDTRDGAILPACVPGLDPSLVLTNFTKSQYSSYLNDTKYTGAGISSEGDWIVVVMTTGTPGGNFLPATAEGFVSVPGGLISYLVFGLSGLLLLLL